MLTTFKVTVHTALMTPSIIIWVLVFPLVMIALFNFMFSSMMDDGSVQPVPVAVVADDAWEGSAFGATVDACAGADDAASGEVDAEGSERAADAAGAEADASEDALLDVRKVPTEAEARELLAAGEVAGVFSVDAEGAPQVLLAPEGSAAHSGDAAYEVNRSILASLANGFVRNRALMEILAVENPQAFSDAAAVERALGISGEVERVSLTRARPNEILRFYYALLGMVTLFGGQTSAAMVEKLLPCESEVGMRRSVGGVSRIRLLLGALAGSWVVSTALLGVAFGWLCMSSGLDFGGREGMCLLAIAVGSLVATGYGALFASLPFGTHDSRQGILTGVTCLLSAFAGLYGDAAMALADRLTHAVPALGWVNPLTLLRDTFYSLYNYDALAPFGLRIAACVAMAAVFFAVAVPMFRRVRYEHL